MEPKQVVVFEVRNREGEIYITDERDALPPDIVKFHKYCLNGSRLEVFHRVRGWALKAQVPYVSVQIGQYAWEHENEPD